MNLTHFVSEFLEGVSQFSVKGDKESKLKFAFQVYDINRDGFISNGELFSVLKMMVCIYFIYSPDGPLGGSP